MVRRLIKKDNVRLLEGDLRERDPTLLTTCHCKCAFIRIRALLKLHK